MDKREEFLRVTDEVAKDRERNPWTAEPWPDWFRKVVLRLARVFIPTLKVAEFKGNRERFEGYGLAFLMGLVEQARNVDRTKLPKNRAFVWAKNELRMISTVLPGEVEEALKAASRLPSDLAAEFFAAYGDGLKRGTFNFAMQRLRDSQTAQICLFLVYSRPRIEAREVSNVTVLFENFMKIKEAFPGEKEFFSKHPQARVSLEQHFRRICSADEVKLAGRGQPKRIRTDRSGTR